MKTILITGSSRGIGKAIAQQAHAKGYKVIVHGKTESDALHATHLELPGSIKTHFDIADKNMAHVAIQRLLDEVGIIDTLVNNAGVVKNFLKDITEVDDNYAIEEYTTNVLGTIHCIQAVIKSMIEQGSGSIINISSIKGHPQLSTTSTLTFASTKAGILSLTQALAKTYAEKGIRINSVSPGYIETDQVANWNKETFERINRGTLLGRIGQPNEIAPLVLFLASDEASYITGTDFLVDGGYMIKGK